jgi:hypothetical protein
MTNLSRKSGVLLVPLHNSQPEGMLATDPDHITITPLGMLLVTMFDTKAVVATWVLLVPFAGVGAVTVPDKAVVPLIDKFPPETLPDTDNAESVPKDVMLGCAAVARVPVIAPLTASEDSVPTDVILGCAAVARVPVIAPLTDNEDSVPIDVILGCAAVAKVPVIAPLTASEDSVPTDVILGCAAVARVPDIGPDAVTDVAVMLPDADTEVTTVGPDTAKPVKVPIEVTLG